LKKLTAIFCLLVLLTQSAMTQPSQALKTNIKNEYGLESGRNYSADEVATLLAIAEEEAETSIQHAYAEGYKAGLLEVAPENARLETLNEQLKADALRYQADRDARIRTDQILYPLCFFLGAAGGFFSGWKLRGSN